MTKIKKLSLIGNSNGATKRIPLGKEVTELKDLEYLNLLGYGISSLPEEFVNLTKLNDLDLSGNIFEEIPYSILERLPNLEYLKMLFCNVEGVTDLREFVEGQETGLGGRLSHRIFNLKNLKELSIANNYFEGNLPTYYGDGVAFPKMELLRIGLNFFTGDLPAWILEHPNLGCWAPEVLVFNQRGTNCRDSEDRVPGFDNIPSFNEIPRCPLFDKKLKTK